MKRIGDFPTGRKVSFSVPPPEAPEQEGGIGPCHCQPCPFGGSIQSGDKWWRCRFHDGRPRWAELVVSNVLADNDAYCRELQRGYNILASHPRTDAYYQSTMLEMVSRCEASKPGRYEFDLSLIDDQPSKLWVHDFRKFVLAMNLQLSKIVGSALKNNRDYA